MLLRQKTEEIEKENAPKIEDFSNKLSKLKDALYLYDELDKVIKMGMTMIDPFR